MAAKDVTVFLPRGWDGEHIFHIVAQDLGLRVERIPPEKVLSSKLSASDGHGASYVLISYHEESGEMIDELVAWEKPSKTYKAILAGCGA